MQIKQWPMLERPREKLLSKGAQYLSDAELLAIFIRTGTKGKTAVDIAREALLHFNDIYSLVNANLNDFDKFSGFGETAYAQIQASLELSKRSLLGKSTLDDVFIDNAKKAQDYLQICLSGQEREVFGVLLLDVQHRIIKFNALFHGSITEAPVYINPLVKTCLDHNASAIILAHNHPSGNSNPSAADIEITHKIITALSLFEVKVLDHFIVTHHKVQSLAELGHIIT